MKLNGPVESEHLISTKKIAKNKGDDPWFNEDLSIICKCFVVIQCD